MNAIENYAAQFRARNGAVPGWLRAIRQTAFDRFSSFGFPSPKLEDWKYTNVAPLTKIAFASDSDVSPENAAALLAAIDLGAGASLVFVHGRFCPDLSRPSTEGVLVESLATRLGRENGSLQPHLGHLTGAEDAPFENLNLALLRDGAVVRIPRGVVVAEPIQLVFLSPASAEPLASHPRVLVVAEEDSEATILETYNGADGSPYFTNAVSEIHLAANARLRHFRLQREGNQGFHIASVAAHQARDSRLTSVAISIGARLSRTSITTALAAEGSECNLDGLYLASAEQHVDHHTSIDHQRPHTTSRELYKGILDGRASGVFNGKVYVRPNALKSDAQQMNKNLLLSDHAEIDTKPQLEIFADDVKCSHGAAIGRLDEQALFYLRARGIGAAEARRLLISAFANELVARVDDERLQAQLGSVLESRFHLEQTAG